MIACCLLALNTGAWGREESQLMVLHVTQITDIFISTDIASLTQDSLFSPSIYCRLTHFSVQLLNQLLIGEAVQCACIRLGWAPIIRARVITDCKLVFFRLVICLAFALIAIARLKRIQGTHQLSYLTL